MREHDGCFCGIWGTNVQESLKASGPDKQALSMRSFQSSTATMAIDVAHTTALPAGRQESHSYVYDYARASYCLRYSSSASETTSSPNLAQITFWQQCYPKN